MGVQGTLEYLSDLISSTKKKKRKQLNTVNLKVRMDCEGCALKMKRVLSRVKGMYVIYMLYILVPRHIYKLSIFSIWVILNICFLVQMVWFGRTSQIQQKIFKKFYESYGFHTRLVSCFYLCFHVFGK